MIPLYPCRQSVFLLWCGFISHTTQHIPMDYPIIAFLLLSQYLNYRPRKDNIGRVVVDARYCAGIFLSPILLPLFIFYTGSMKDSDRLGQARVPWMQAVRACQHFTVKCSTMETPVHE